MPAAWGAKDERMYQHIRKSCQLGDRRRSVRTCKRIAAATVNKRRRLEGRTLSGYTEEFTKCYRKNYLKMSNKQLARTCDAQASKLGELGDPDVSTGDILKVAAASAAGTTAVILLFRAFNKQL